MQNFSGHPDQKFGHITYAQHGDDLMLLNLFALLKIEKPSYLDLGAHHPFIISNTALLYKRGSRGVNVEANPNLMAAFKEHRPEDKNVNIGVGPKNDILKFYMYSATSGRNTFSLEETESLKGILRVKETKDIPVVTIDAIVKKYCDGKYPNLLSIDLEGLDYAVLESADFSRSSPDVICVETRFDQTLKMRDLLNSKGFLFHSRVGENLFFISEKHKQKMIFL